MSQDSNADSYRANAVSLFSGLGGMDIGLHQAGIKTEVCIEKDKNAVKTLEKNAERKYPWSVMHRDVRDVSVEEILEEAEVEKQDIDMVVGGTPCQPFSKSNEGSRRGTNEDRGRLFEEFVRILNGLEADKFIFENVPGIKSANNGKDLERIKNAFRGSGFKIKTDVLNTANYGVPQKRRRLIVIGDREKRPSLPEATHSKEEWVSTGKALEGIDVREDTSKLSDIGGTYGHLLEDIPPGANYQHFSERKYDAEKAEYVERSDEELDEKVFDWRSRHWNYLLKLDPNRPSWTIQAQPGKYIGPFHWNSRRLAINELKRIMDIPQDYKVKGDSRKVKQWQIGNAVPPALAKNISDSLTHGE